MPEFQILYAKFVEVVYLLKFENIVFFTDIIKMHSSQVWSHKWYVGTQVTKSAYTIM